MATLNYLAGRKKYGRPQALMFAESPGTVEEGDNGITHVPQGYEVGTNSDQIDEEGAAFLILSDHNRGGIDVKNNRIQQRERTINGKMRSFFVADKFTLSVSWQNLPSRSFSNIPKFNVTTGKDNGAADKYTVDGGAGGNELLDWYLTHPESFYLFISYDRYSNFKDQTNTMDRIKEYQEVKEIYITDFSYNVTKRSPNTYDLWDVNITLEEV